MKQLFDIIPEQYFVNDLKENTLGTIKIAVLREVIGNAIIRSNYPDETITFKLSDKKDVVEVPARKMKSREKLLGLKICRQFGVVDKDLRYNVIKKSEQLANPNSVLFGDSVTESGDSVAITSRVIYDWAYSIRDISELTSTLQHNALSEDGTMNDEEKVDKLRRSLFQVQYVKPGTFLPHFMVVENVTPELFIHLLTCVIRQSRYFAQSTTNSPSNIQNHILGIGFSKFEHPINSYTIAKNWNDEEAVTLQSVTNNINNTMVEAYGDHYKKGKDITEFISDLWKEESVLKATYSKAQKDCTQFLKDIKITK